jgi:hypothetical protein
VENGTLKLTPHYYKRSSCAFDLDNIGSRMSELNTELNEKDKAKSEQEANKRQYSY